MSTQDNLTRELNTLNEDEVLALTAILREYRSAKKKHPVWPNDMVHASAIISEEAGELTKECLQYAYECPNPYEAGERYDRICAEATQVGAMGLRFLTNVTHG